MFINSLNDNLRLPHRIILTSLLLFFITAIFFESVIHLINRAAFYYPFVKKGFSLICHQDEGKIINLFGFHSLVCARCTGIYLGMFMLSTCTLFNPIKKIPGIKWFLIFTIPMLADVFLVNLGFYSYSKLSAIITGIFFGSVLFVYFYNGLNLLITEIQKRQ